MRLEVHKETNTMQGPFLKLMIAKICHPLIFTSIKNVTFTAIFNSRTGLVLPCFPVSFARFHQILPAGLGNKATCSNHWAHAPEPRTVLKCDCDFHVLCFACGLCGKLVYTFSKVIFCHSNIHTRCVEYLNWNVSILFCRFKHQHAIYLLKRTNTVETQIEQCAKGKHFVFISYITFSYKLRHVFWL